MWEGVFKGNASSLPVTCSFVLLCLSVQSCRPCCCSGWKQPSCHVSSSSPRLVSRLDVYYGSSLFPLPTASILVRDIRFFEALVPAWCVDFFKKGFFFFFFLMWLICARRLGAVLQCLYQHGIQSPREGSR